LFARLGLWTSAAWALVLAAAGLALRWAHR